MNIVKPNDILVASINNPNSTTLDFLSADVTPDNTSLFKKEDYLTSPLIQKKFTDEKGQFNTIAFDEAYNKAASHYKEMTDDSFLKNLTEATYSPFDVTRPLGAKTFDTRAQFTPDFNPFKQLYSRTGINSVDDNSFTLRELAQQNKVYDPETKTWSEKTANDLGIFEKFLGDTLVYGQWDQDGTHTDAETNRTVKHKKGDWKFDSDGNLFLEKLGNREIYGKQVVNPMDMLTTDGSLANQFDFFDADSRDKSVGASTAKWIFDIAPFFIPGVAPVYGGIRAAVNLAAVLPGFYKSLEGILLGDNKSPLTDTATAAESYMAKFKQNSVSDTGAESFFTYEQMSQMVGQIFGQIYEQRAVASLSNLIKKPSLNRLSEKGEELAKKINDELVNDVVSQKISVDKFFELRDAAFKKIPELESVIKSQSKMSKGLALGYMALTQSADVYSQAIEGGYDRRTAGFASLTAAAGQYGLMMNNRMGDWFLDKSTGFSLEHNRALVRKSVLPWLDDFKKGMDLAGKDVVAGKASLAGTVSKVKNSLYNTFTNPSVLGEAMWKNAVVEGVEEVTEQVAIDATKGIVDVMSYLGLTKKEGSFGGTDVVFSKSGLENYLANFVGGILGGGLFEFQRIKIDPLISGKAINQDTKEEMYDLIANGKKDEIIDIINKQKSTWGNQYIGPTKDDGTFDVANGKDVLSVADIVANRAIDAINELDGLLNSQDLGQSDEEIVRKTLRDHILIDQLKLDRGKSTIGIEGVILKETKELRSKIVDLTAKINTLIADDEKNKNESSKDAIKSLEEEREVYKKARTEILSGEKAEFYFGQAAWYLSKSISSDFVTIDKETFTQAKYKRSFNELPDKGLNISKERVNKEFKEFTDSKDIKEYLDLGFRAYLNLEKEFNKPIEEFVTTGYSDEVNKTFKNLLNLTLTEHLFDTNNEDIATTIQNYIIKAKEIEERTGKRVMPWEAINNSLAKELIGTKAFKIKDGDSLVTMGESQVTKREIAEAVLAEVIGVLPPEQVDYEMVKDGFNDLIKLRNKEILDSKKEQLDPLIAEFNSITDEEATTDKVKGERKQELADEINGHGIEAELVSYEDLQDFKDQFNTILEQLQVVHAKNGLTDKIIKRFEGLQGLTKYPGIPSKVDPDEMIELIIKYGQILDLSLDPNALREKTVEEINDSNLSEEEKKSILDGEAYTGNNEEVKNILRKYNAELNHMADLINANMIEYNQELDIYKSYLSEVEQQKAALIKSQPEMFNTIDILIPAIIKELKSNKNLDAELLDLAKQVINGYLKPFITMSTTFSVSNSDILTLTDLSNSELQTLISQISQLRNEFDVNPDEFTSRLWDKIKPFKSKLPVGVLNAIKMIEDSSSDNQKTLIAQLNSFTSMLTKVLNTRKNLIPVKELVDLITDESSFIKNSIYTFIKNFDVYLDRDSKMEKGKIWDILREEESKLFDGSSVDAYFSNGFKVQDLTTAINTLNMLQAIVRGMSSTQLTYSDPIGFIASRQAFAKRNKIESEVNDLTTVTSDNAELMLKSLNRIKMKLQFLRDLAKFNSGLIAKEQAIIKAKFNKLLVANWAKLVKDGISFKEKPVIPDIDDILRTTESDEQKLIKIEDKFYNHLKEYSTEEKIEIGKLLAAKFKYINLVDNIYSNDGTDEITKDIKSISNNDMLVYLLSSMSVMSSDFALKLVNALKTKFDKAPFFTQELGLKIMYASTVERDLFSEVLSSISPIRKTKEDINGVQAYDTNLITYVLGNAGTGKTTVMYKLYLAMLQQSNKHLNIWFSGPGIEQANKLSSDVLKNLEDSSITPTNFSKEQILNKMGLKEIMERIKKDGDIDIQINKKGEYLESNDVSHFFFIEDPSFTIPSDLPDVIFIDEVSHYTALELYLINEVVKKASLDGGKKVKVFAAGDTLQRGVDYNGINYNIGRVSGVFAPTLFLTIRAQNNQKRDNNDLLSVIVRSINRFWVNQSRSNDKVFSDIIQEGITLRYHVDASKNIFHGDKVVSNTIPLDLLMVISADITKNPKKVIGILTDSSGEISDDLLAKLTSAKIPEANYKKVSPDKVQGQEFDYFIFNLSDAEEKSVLDTLKSIYTYSSRSKDGTIIVDDKTLTFGQKDLKLINKEELFTEKLIPISPDMIISLKEARTKELITLLDGKSTIENDFVFDPKANVTINLPQDILMSTNDETDVDDIEEDGKDTVLKFSMGKFSHGTYEGSQNIMVHPFYHDNNVIESKKGDKIKITKNVTGKYNYGLEYLLKQFQTESLELSQEQYDKSMDFLIRAKFSVLKNKKLSVDIIKTIFNDNTITLNDLSYKGFVLTMDSYNEASNKPRDLKYDSPEKHLQNGTKYVNLMYKMVLKSGKEYYLHLGTFPDIKTVERIVKEVFANDPVRQKVIESYKSLLEDNEPGNIIELDTKAVSTITSTRLWGEKDKAKRKKTTLRELMKTKGVIFYDNAYNVVAEPTINFFPKDFDNYKKLFTDTFFGQSVSDQSKENFDNAIKKSFETRAGRPYITVSFTEDPKTVRFITMHSTSRSWDEIKKIIAGDSTTPSLPARLMTASQNKKKTPSPENTQVLEKTFAIAGSLFSGNDVLDLLISLAVENPDLYKKLLTDGTIWLKSVLNAKDDPANKEMLLTLFKHLSVDASETVLDAITYGDKNTKAVYTTIQAEIDNGNTDPVQIKKNVLDKIIRTKEGKYWFSAFWNIFKLEDKLFLKTQQHGAGSQIDKDFLKVIDAVIGFWKSKKDRIYYNIPIKSIKEGTVLVGDLSDKSILDNLYTNLSPEGPKLLVNLEGIVKTGINPAKETLNFLSDPNHITEAEIRKVADHFKLNSKGAMPSLKQRIANSSFSLNDVKEALDLIRNPNKEDQELIKLTHELNQIIHNKKAIISPEKTDTSELLKTKIEKANLIKSLLSTKSGKLKDLLMMSVKDLRELVSQSSPELGYMEELKRFSFPPASNADIVRERIILMLDGKRFKSSDVSESNIIKEITILLDFIKNKKLQDPNSPDLKQLLASSTDDSFFNFLSKVMELDENGEMEDLPELLLC